MRFTGQVRIPEIDHPGIPAVVVVEDSQVEIFLEGESLGRWSLYDVRARRLVASAFQLDLGGEELTFIADEPIDFAYRGVEHMAEVWARYKAMRGPRRGVAVRGSRRGTSASRISELTHAMEVNIRSQHAGILQQPTTSQSEPSTPVSAAPKQVSEPAPDDAALSELERIDVARKALEADRARLEEERSRFEQFRHEAETQDAHRIEAFRMEMERLETERRQSEKSEAERADAFRSEMQRLEGERLKLEQASVDAKVTAEKDSERTDTIDQEMAQLKEDRKELERREAERIEAAAQAMAEVEERRKQLEKVEAERIAEHQAALKVAEEERRETERMELERLEAERLEAERLEAERLQAEALEAKRLQAERAQAETLKAQALETERLQEERVQAEALQAEAMEAERVQAEALQAETLKAEALEAERVQAERLESERLESERLEDELREREDAAAAARAGESHMEEVLDTSADGEEDPDSSKGLVVDLGDYERDSSSRPPEPILTGAAPKEKAGLMGAVRSAFGRSGKNHEHQFVEAPGGFSISRSICTECGYVSISASD